MLDFYNEAGEYFSKTRQKSYGIAGDYNLPYVTNMLKELNPGDKILDLGCGDGRLISGLPSRVEYVGIDFSETLLAQAKKRYKGRKFIAGDISEPKTYKNLGKYDRIFCIATLHHIPTKKEQLKVLRLAHEHLKKNGVIIITVWNLVQMRYLSEQVKSLRMKSRNLRWVGIPFQKKYMRYCFTFDKRYLSEIMLSAGYHIESIRYVDRDGREVGAFDGRDLMVVARKG